MHFFAGVVIFILVALVYLHVVGQYETGTDLEIYEVDYVDPMSLHETCNILQPVIVEWKAKIPPPTKYMETCKFVMNVKDRRSFYDGSLTQGVSLICASAVKLLRQDVQSHYFTENNYAFLDDSGFLKNPKYLELDKVLRPPYTVQAYYDVLTGSQGTAVPLRYHTATRKFLYVVSGKISVKMTTWKYRDWLDVTKDFEHFDFRSEHAVFGNPDLEETIQFLSFDVPKGAILYVPPFWFYSFQYQEADTVILEYNYATLVNKCAFVLDSAQFYLQQQNIFTKTTKRIYTHVSQITDEDTTAPK
jgi:hypothetical protein